MNTQQQEQQLLPEDRGSSQPPLILTWSVVEHIQRIATRTADPVLLETARKAQMAYLQGQNEAPGVHLTYVTPEQAVELVDIAVRTQDRELANFARYLESVIAGTTHIAVEPIPGKIKEELEKGRLKLAEAEAERCVYTGPGFGPAFATVPVLTADIIARCERIANRTGDRLLHETAERAKFSLLTRQQDPDVHLTWVTPEQAEELVNLAVLTQDRELADFARYCQSVAGTPSKVALEPYPGAIQAEIEKGKEELLKNGAAYQGAGYGLAFATVPGSGGF